MDFVYECQVIHGFSVFKCCFCYLNILNLNMSHIFLVVCHKKFHVFHKSDSSWSRDRLDFRRLPGPVLILPEERPPSGGMSAGSFSRTAAGNRAYYKVRWIYYKLRQVLQGAMIYYKLRQYIPFLNPEKCTPFWWSFGV